jgi:putative copper export protein
VVVWCALLGAIVLLFAAQFLALELALTRADVMMLVRDTAWGRGWAMLAASSMAFAMSVLGRAPWMLRASLALLTAISMSGLGHAAADDVPLLARTLDSVHVVGVGAWIGALVLLHAETAPAVWRRFSALATIASAAVVLTGVGATWLRLGASSFGAIASSDYGQLLALKVALVVVVLGFGYAHRRAVRGERVPTPRSMQLELTFAAIVLVATAWLTGTSLPGE